MEKVMVKVARISQLWTLGGWGLYQSNMSASKIAHYYGEDALIDRIMFRIVGDDGRVYLWQTTKRPKVNDTIKGFIKGYKVWNGEDQTIITRCSIE